MSGQSELEELREQMIEAAIKQISNMLGFGAKNVLFRSLKSNFNIEVGDLWDNPEEFHRALTTLLGKGADVIENIIVDGIKENLGIYLENKKPVQIIADVKESLTVAAT